MDQSHQSWLIGKETRRALSCLQKELREEPFSGLRIAKETLRLLRIVVSSLASSGLEKVEDAVRQLGTELTRGYPRRFIAENMARRVLKVIHEEYDTANSTNNARLDASELGRPPREQVKNAKVLKSNVLEAISEIEDELDAVLPNITEQSLEHIHSNEVLLTFGYSQSVEEFLKSAAEKRHFEVIIAECELDYSGHRLAKNLNKANVDITLISDAAVVALMSRVHKVIIGAEAIMADGSVLAASGTFMVAAAARHYAVPLVICAGLHKLTPLFPHHPDILYDILSPSQVIQNSTVWNESWFRQLEISCPRLDLIHSQYIRLLVTNSGGFSPSYVYRILNEFYDEIDTCL
ncbi:Translation initiation factor eIF-2B subunit beta [Galdieria sulphuraria]|uniref:Translation initiation factor eIF2B subunit beta n=1 Tax=Galdieria sulphuraria TaxID=130081 RepID=M2XN08_GALSU|nr:translation initiation factor eIF-2B beta subunit [Galdieria sulphuraria]EME31592.1 translation initiation factor eIF-2B beta subunit [Galdieria sulphuraria]GJD08806.1 Translation initiation factor eIF-2B subunit beta [Galdieria sulphuraria]|eukprot:XP_005708112.1 translation initiation factor eIF-2B beta subunit [Galdieria sulphuraria]